MLVFLSFSLSVLSSYHAPYHGTELESINRAVNLSAATAASPGGVQRRLFGDLGGAGTSTLTIGSPLPTPAILMSGPAQAAAAAAAAAVGAPGSIGGPDLRGALPDAKRLRPIERKHRELRERTRLLCLYGVPWCV